MREIVENNQEFRAIALKYEKVYLYGAGVEGKRIIKLLKKWKISVTAIIVSDKKDNPHNLMGIEVLELQAIQPGDKNLFVMGVSTKFEREISEVLQKKGHHNIVKIQLPKLEITVKIGCNIQCKYCPQSDLLRSYFKYDKNREVYLSLENYKKAVNNMPDDAIITFSGFCEPFLHPQAVEMIEYANQKGHPIELFTTFSNLTMADFERIKDIPFRTVVLHTPDKMKFANIPLTNDYKCIIDEALNYRKVSGELFINRANCQSEPSEEFLELAKGRILVKSELIDRAGLLEGEGLKKSLHKTGKLVCTYSCLQNHWVLLPDGTVTLCCMDFGLKHVLGNLLHEDYQHICENQIYKNIRIQMGQKDTKRDLLCCDCTAAIEETDADDA